MGTSPKELLAVSVAAALGGSATPAAAAPYTATLQQVLVYNYSSSQLSGDITSSTATWSYASGDDQLIQTGGVYEMRLATSATGRSTLYRVSVTGLVVGRGRPATASTFVCTEGNFGAGVGASICGNYDFGANFVNESTVTWGPGTAVSRTLGGDDVATGPPLSVSQFDGMVELSFPVPEDRSVLSNRTCTGPCATLPAGAFNGGQQWTLALVPPPDAVLADDEVTTGTGATRIINVLGNDYLPYADFFSYGVAVAPDKGGTVERVYGDPSWMYPLLAYTPAPGFSGVETFTYSLSYAFPFPRLTAVVRVTVVDALTNPDGDGDGIADMVDNCVALPDPIQCDSDFDGYGNRCDGDLNGNGLVTAQDVTIFRSQLGLPSVGPIFNKADINCSGDVNAQDATLLRQLLGSPPGPSGRVP